MVGKVKTLVRDVLEGGKVAVLVALAASNTKPDLRNRRARGRHSPRPADTALLAADCEAVEVVTGGFQSLDLDMYGMAEFRMRYHFAPLHDLPHTLVACDLPLELDRLVGHAAAVEGFGRDPGPQHGTSWRWIARGDSEREGVVSEDGLCPDPTREERSAGGQKSGRADSLQPGPAKNRKIAVDVHACHRSLREIWLPLSFVRDVCLKLE